MNMANKTSILYGVIGLLAGVIITSCFHSYHRSWDGGMNGKKQGMHYMANGKMMSNEESHMEGMMQDMMEGLQGKTGDDFDKAFLSEMIVHHQGAVEMAQSALKNAKHQEIKDLAGNIITAQNKEIGMMKEWEMSWYK